MIRHSAFNCVSLPAAASFAAVATFCWLDAPVAGSQWPTSDAATTRGHPPAFVDVTQESGLPSFGKTSGCALVDLDGDGDLDLLLGRHSDLPEAYRYEGPRESAPHFARWRDWCPEAATLVKDHHATAVGDFDADGDHDLYFVVGAERGRGTGDNILVEATRHGYHVVARLPELDDPYGRGRGALFLDALGHTRLDLLVLNYKSPFRLFVAVGQSGFVDRAPAVDDMVAIPESLLAVSPEARVPSHHIHKLYPVDFDHDGRLDFAAMGGPPLALYRGAPGQRFEAAYERIPPQAYLPSPAAATWGDLDGDGWMDLVLVYGDGPDPGRNRLLLGSKGGFVDAEDPGTDGPEHEVSTGRIGTPGLDTPEPKTRGLGAGGIAVRCADFDQDGRLDLYLVRRRGTESDRANVLLLQQPDGGFQPRFVLDDDVPAGRVDAGVLARGAATVAGGVSEDALAHDFDGDGDLDLLLLQGAHDDAEGPGGVRLLRNDLAAGNWITLRLIGGRGSNQEGYGARVGVATGGRTQWQQHWPTQVAGSSMPLPLHFGLGKATTVATVTIHWPSGRTQIVEGLTTNGHWVVEEGRPPRLLSATD